MEMNRLKIMILTLYVGRNSKYDARFEVLTAMLLKIEVFWDVTTCRLLNSYRRFGGS
jgi:hypothetical protein